MNTNTNLKPDALYRSPKTGTVRSVSYITPEGKAFLRKVAGGNAQTDTTIELTANWVARRYDEVRPVINDSTQFEVVNAGA